MNYLYSIFFYLVFAIICASLLRTAHFFSLIFLICMVAVVLFMVLFFSVPESYGEHEVKKRSKTIC